MGRRTIGKPITFAVPDELEAALADLCAGGVTRADACRALIAAGIAAGNVDVQPAWAVTVEHNGKTGFASAGSFARACTLAKEALS
jgi:hypothetical protein